MSTHINSTLAYLRLVEAPQSIIDNVAALATERDALLAALLEVSEMGSTKSEAVRIRQIARAAILKANAD
jgi:hypothetical protein